MIQENIEHPDCEDCTHTWKQRIMEGPQTEREYNRDRILAKIYEPLLQAAIKPWYDVVEKERGSATE